MKRFVSAVAILGVLLTLADAGALSPLVKRRDLSTPSRRIVGHWRQVESGNEVYYSPASPATHRGRVLLLTASGHASIHVWIVRGEDLNGLRLDEEVIGPYGSTSLWADYLPRDGRTFIAERRDVAEPVTHYVYVDDRLAP